MIILLYSRYDELKLLIIPAFYQPSTKQLIIASHTQQLGWCKLSDIWINRVALGWISAISLRTFQFFNGYFLRVNPQVKQFSPNSYSVWWALHYVKTFKTDIIDFIGKIRTCSMSHWLIIFCIIVRSLIPTISPSEIKGKMSEFFISKIIPLYLSRVIALFGRKKRCMSNFIFIFTNHITCVWDQNWRIEECNFVI
jgi:hypothetical protein